MGLQFYDKNGGRSRQQETSHAGPNFNRDSPECLGTMVTTASVLNICSATCVLYVTLVFQVVELRHKVTPFQLKVLTGTGERGVKRGLKIGAKGDHGGFN